MIKTVKHKVSVWRLSQRHWYMNFLNNGVISYKSKLQPSVTLSIAAAEDMGLADQAHEVIYLRKLLEEIGFPQIGATVIWEDNKAAILAAEGETSSTGRMKHVDIKFRFIAEKDQTRGF